MITTLIAATAMSQQVAPANPGKDPRLNWFHDAKFGMFIHWGLYSVLEGEHGASKGHAEWIRTTAQIPVGEYEKLLGRFNPVKFDSDEWARMAKDAGMQYVVITSKHHDGFALFDSAETDWDVMSTPFKRDIMGELSKSVRGAGLKMCWYHSIMDWHHPDYLPRRDWELAGRPVGDASFDRFNGFLERQVSELLTKYGPIGIMWFDGEWESTWNHARGQKLYDLCRRLQPNVIVNDRVDVGRGGMAGMSDSGFAGDYGTPEQEVPETGIPGVSWESCITMNAHWGWNRADTNWKSTPALIQLLVDIVSKGGNLLLNIGPKPDGTFPAESVTRLREIGSWMRTNGDGIYGTTASPFEHLSWGRATQKGNSVYLFVFDPPKDGIIRVPGLLNKVVRAVPGGSREALEVSRSKADVLVHVGKWTKAEPMMVRLDLDGKARVVRAPAFPQAVKAFYGDSCKVEIAPMAGLALRYTTDGSEPSARSKSYSAPFEVVGSTTVKAAYFLDGEQAGPVGSAVFERVPLRPPLGVQRELDGLYSYDVVGNWDKLPMFEALDRKRPTLRPGITLAGLSQPEFIARSLSGFVEVPSTGVYTFVLTSDDGSRLLIDNQVVVDHDGLHGATAKTGIVALAKGHHTIRLDWFNKSGGLELKLAWSRDGGPIAPVPHSVFWTVALR